MTSLLDRLSAACYFSLPVVSLFLLPRICVLMLRFLRSIIVYIESEETTMGEGVVGEKRGEDFALVFVFLFFLRGF
jgi:hypothetical protein